MKTNRELNPTEFEIAFQLKNALNELRNYQDIPAAIEHIESALTNLYEW